MAEEYIDYGGALALQTGLQPDKSRPFTQVGKNLLANEMAKQAAEAKAKKEDDKLTNTIASSLKGYGKFDATLDPIARQLQIDATRDLYNSRKDPYKQTQIQQQYLSGLERLKFRQDLRDKIYEQIDKKGYGNTKIAQLFTQGREDEIMKLPFQETFTSNYGGDVTANLPDRLNLGKVFEDTLTSAGERIGIFDPVTSKLPDGKLLFKGTFSDAQLKNMATDLAEDKNIRENIYLNNPEAIDAKAQQLMVANPDMSAIAAKKRVVSDVINEELASRNETYKIIAKNNGINININQPTRSDIPINPMLGEANSFVSALDKPGYDSQTIYTSVEGRTIPAQGSTPETTTDPQKATSALLGIKPDAKYVSTPIPLKQGLMKIKLLTGSEHTGIVDAAEIKTFQDPADGVVRNFLVLDVQRPNGLGTRKIITRLETNLNTIASSVGGDKGVTQKEFVEKFLTSAYKQGNIPLDKLPKYGESNVATAGGKGATGSGTQPIPKQPAPKKKQSADKYNLN